MSFFIFLCVLLSAALHAGWNVLNKQGKPAVAFPFLMSVGNGIWWCWTLYFFRCDFSMLGSIFYLLVLVSIITETVYMGSIPMAYRRMDISQAYPMIRALPVLLVALIWFLLPPHHAPGWLGLGGLMVVCAGCILLPLRNFHDFSLANYRGEAMKFICLAALGTTGYTLCDAVALNMLKSASASPGWLASCFYLWAIESGIAIGLGIVVFLHHDERQELKRILKTAPFRPFCAGLASSSAYALILFAMLHVQQLGFLQAFRQMSLPLGVLAGALLFKEKVTVSRWTGVTLIVIGLVMIAFQRG